MSRGIGTLAGRKLPPGRNDHPARKPRIPALLINIAGWLRPLDLGKHPFWLTVAMVIVGGALHNVNNLFLYDPNTPLHLSRHSMDRVLMMIPVVYAGFIVGPRGGFITLIAVTLLMLPRVLLIYPSSPDSIMEVFSVVLVSSLIILWFRGQQREKKRRQEVLTRLEMARQELAAQVEIITKDERRLAAINEICAVVTQSLDLPQILQRILDKIVEEMGVEVAMIFLKDKPGQKLELVAHKGVSNAFAAAMSSLRVGQGFNGSVAQSGESMVVEDASQDCRLCTPEVKDEGLQSQLIVPLRSKGITTGTLCVAVRSSRRFTTDDVELLTAVGSQVGIAIENARLYQEVLTSEEEYRDLFENATVAIFVHDLAGLITAANKACTKLTGYQWEELIGLQVNRLFPSPCCDVLIGMEQKLLRDETIFEPYDIHLLRKDGTQSILSLTTRLVSENGQPTGFQYIARDVTERRRMRDTLNYYVRQILTAQEEERKRIARELHDETAQSMLLILQRIDTLTCASTRGLSHRAKKELEELRGVVLQTLGDLRRLTRDLRPQILDDLGLVAAVEWLAEETERQCGVKTNVEVLGPQRRLTPETQLLLFRIAQEALSNVRRHSAASNTKIVLEFGLEKAVIIIEDNGRGFKMPQSLGDLATTGKLGLLGMSERARLAGGSIVVHSQPGLGTRVRAELAA